MNAFKTHYVANAGAKVQLFFGLATTLPYFFCFTAPCAPPILGKLYITYI